MCAPATGPDRPAWAELPLGDGVPWCCDSRWAREHGPGRRGRGRSKVSTATSASAGLLWMPWPCLSWPHMAPCSGLASAGKEDRALVLA